MLFGEYQFLCRLESEANLPHFKGSTFRGVFGRALKRVVCALKKETCESCLLNSRCMYTLVFENAHPASPHPFVIEPPLTRETLFQKDSLFAFSLLVFGELNRNLPYFIYAFEQMGQIGIGKRVNGQRGRFTLEEVKSGGRPIYSGPSKKIDLDGSFEDIVLDGNARVPGGTLRLRVDLVTPLRLKYRNRLKAELPFHVLVRAMLRRLSSLFNTYDKGEPALDYRGLVRKAEGIQIVDSRLTWYDWERYSSRQDKAMLMGGMMGHVTYEGEIGEYVALLDFCSRVHMGKQTTFGLGKIKAEILG